MIFRYYSRSKRNPQFSSQQVLNITAHEGSQNKAYVTSPNS